MKFKKYLYALCVVTLLAVLLTVPAFAAGGDVAGAVEQTWDDAATQIKTVVDNVVFPALSMILAIAFFVVCRISRTVSGGSLSGPLRQFYLSALSSYCWPPTISGASSDFKNRRPHPLRLRKGVRSFFAGGGVSA